MLFRLSLGPRMFASSAPTTLLLSNELRDIHVAAAVTAMEHAWDGILGARKDHTPEKAEKVDGEWLGGVAWERSDFAVPIGKAERCFTMGQSYQLQHNLAGPSAGAKLVDGHGEPTPHHDMRLEAIQVDYDILPAFVDMSDEE